MSCLASLTRCLTSWTFCSFSWIIHHTLNSIFPNRILTLSHWTSGSTALTSGLSRVSSLQACRSVMRRRVNLTERCQTVGPSAACRCRRRCSACGHRRWSRAQWRPPGRLNTETVLHATHCCRKPCLQRYVNHSVTSWKIDQLLFFNLSGQYVSWCFSFLSYSRTPSGPDDIRVTQLRRWNSDPELKTRRRTYYLTSSWRTAYGI